MFGPLGPCSPLKSFEVENRTSIPTHCVLKLSLTRNSFKEKGTFIQKLGSLKNNIEDQWREAFKDLGPKEVVVARTADVEKLQANLDELSRQASRQLDAASRMLDTDTFWRIWSETVEKAYHGDAELSVADAKRNAGRGTVKLIQRFPEMKAKEDDRIRNKWSYEARRCLRQARRLEQIMFRVQCKRAIVADTPEPLPPGVQTSAGAPSYPCVMEVADDETIAQHRTLNARALQLLLNNVSKGSRWESGEVERLGELSRQQSPITMDTPFLKRLATCDYAVNRRNSVEEYRKEQDEAQQKNG